jgi:virginiamycin B lyase
MRTSIRNLIWVSAIVFCATLTLSAAELEIHGIVTDEAGKPIRGAMIKAIAGGKTVARFSQADGRYEITLPGDSYDISAEAFGFKPKTTKNVTQSGETNFSLRSGILVSRLNGAEIQSLLPYNDETKFIEGECVHCHSFQRVALKRGYTAAEWMAFIPTMPKGRLPFNPPGSGPHEDFATLTAKDFATPAMVSLSQALEKYFGPDSPYLGPDADPPKAEQVQHADPSDAVLRATVREYSIPTGLESMPHSIMIDSRDDAWFSEVGLRGNKIGRFDVKSETFTEYPLFQPHTGVEGKDGLLWYSQQQGPDLASVDPKTGKTTSYWIYDRKQGTQKLDHIPTVDLDGNIWCAGNSVWKFDVKTKTFKEYKVPVPSSLPENSIDNWRRVPYAASNKSFTKFYTPRVDSKNYVWVSAFAFGELIRIDPRTGETKSFHAPDTPSIRGMTIDAQDNVWFAGINGNAIGKLDPTTGTFKLYHPPTKYAMPYGILADKKTGYIWYSDMNGSLITRFDPKTEEFAEFPIPTDDAASHFIDVDSKGRVWFTEYLNGKIGFLDPAGEGGRISSVR